MEISFNKRCIKKALSFLRSNEDFYSFSLLNDLSFIEKEIDNPFSDISRKGILDANMRNKYLYIRDFEKLLRNYNFLFHDNSRLNRCNLKYWNNRLMIDYYAIIGYLLMKFNLISCFEEYLNKDENTKVILRV